MACHLVCEVLFRSRAGAAGFRAQPRTYSYRIMKSTLLTAAASLAGAAALTAGEYIAPAPVQAPSLEPVEEKGVSGTLSLDAYTHFVSYGTDVWSDGSSMSQWGFNPSLELSWDLGAGFSFSLGTWWDVNSKTEDRAPSGANPDNTDFSVGGNIQEIDVWGTLGWSNDFVSTSVTYQEWYFGESTERIVDYAVGLDTFLSPSLLLHQRVQAGAVGDEGLVLVGGIEYGFEVGGFAFAVPVNVGFMLTDDFHFDGADSGYGYTSVGLQTSIALPFLDSIGGEWAFNGGVTYYTTNNDVVNPGESGEFNSQNDFLTANAGISCSF